MHIFSELQLRIIKRDERHLDPVGACRDDDRATEILEVGDRARSAIDGQVHRHVPHRAGGHFRATRHDTTAVTAGVLIIATEPGIALSRQPTGVALEGMQHTVQRRNIKRPILPNDRLGQRGSADINIV